MGATRHPAHEHQHEDDEDHEQRRAHVGLERSPARRPGPVVTSSGRMTLRQSPTRSTRRASRSAAKRRRPSLASSDGWMRNDSVPSHRVEPPAAMPTPGIEHEDEQHERAAQQGQHRLAPAVVVGQRRADQHGRPDGHPDELALEEDPRAAVAAQGLDRRGRQHHHQPDRAQHGDDGGQQHPAAVLGRRLDRSAGRPGRPSPSVERVDVFVGIGAPPAGRGRQRRSRRPARRRSGTSRTRRSRATAARRRPGGRPRRLRPPRRPWTRPGGRARGRRTRRPPRAPPRRWRRRPAHGRPTSASSPRSRPLLRPPAMSTTDSKPRTAATAAWGLVALESSYQRTPSA